MRNFAREFLAAAEITSRAKNRFAYFLPAQSGISDDKDPKWRGPFRDSFRSNVKKSIILVMTVVIIIVRALYGRVKIK